MWLTIFVTTAFNCVLGWGVIFDSLTWKDYIATMAPINMMVVSFWLGRESARPDRDREKDAH